MARKNRVIDSKNPLHIAARCINKDWFGLPLPFVWEVMSEQLFYLRHALDVEVLSFVLMSNHFHLIARFPNENMSASMRHFLQESSRIIMKPADRINGTWAGRYFSCSIKEYRYFCHAYKYVYRNPVQAGIVERVEEYPYSTLPGLLGLKPIYFPVMEDLTLFSDLEGTLDWLNQASDPQMWEVVRKALRRKEFCLPKKNTLNFKHPLDLHKL